MYLIDITDFSEIFNDEDRVDNLINLLEEELKAKGIVNNMPKTIQILASVVLEDEVDNQQDVEDVGGF